MTGWVGGSADIARRDRLVQGLAGTGMAAGVLLKIAGAPTWMAIVVAAVGVAAAFARLVLEVLRYRVERREVWDALLVEPPRRVRDLVEQCGFYDLGVETEAPEALAAAGQADRTHAVYLDRDVDETLRERLRGAASRSGPSLMVVVGPSKAGKSRTLAEAAVVVLSDAWLLVPRDPEAVAKLTRGRPPREVSSGPCIIWLDDLEPFVRPGEEG